MARGPKKHMKRLRAPKHWMLGKLDGIWAPRPSTGPHKLRECLPVILVLRNRLKYALTRREVQMIVMKRLLKVDGKVRTDMNYPSGFMDVISLDRTGEHFRLLFDTKGRFVLQSISKEAAKFKLCKVRRVGKANKATIGRNPFQTGQSAAIPYIVTHDGRTIRYVDPDIKVNDTIKLDLTTGKVVDFLKYEVGNTCMITRGANMGRVGTLVKTERSPGSFDIVHLKDKKGHEFCTRLENVFVIGDKKSWVELPRAAGVRKTILEVQASSLKRESKN